MLRHCDGLQSPFTQGGWCDVPSLVAFAAGGEEQQACRQPFAAGIGLECAAFRSGLSALTPGLQECDSGVATLEASGARSSVG